MLISPVTWQNKQTAPLLMVVILVAHIHDLKNCQKSTASVDASVDPFVANMSVTTSFPKFSHEDAWVNAQLRSSSATTNYVVFISGSEFGTERKSRSLSTQSERVTHLHIEPHQKNTGYPSGIYGLKKRWHICSGILTGMWSAWKGEQVLPNPPPHVNFGSTLPTWSLRVCLVSMRRLKSLL